MPVTKSHLIEQLSSRAKLPKQTAEHIVNLLFDSMIAAMVRGDRIEIRGFGSFEVRHYKAYEGRNPRTGEAVSVEAKKLPFFKVGKDLRERINQDAPDQDAGGGPDLRGGSQAHDSGGSGPGAAMDLPASLDPSRRTDEPGF